MILVTGGSGFVGGHLVRHLATTGVPVRALYNSRPPQGDLRSLPNVSWLQCDLLDVYAVEEAMQGITEVYHCAAIVSFAPRMAEQMLHFNPESTANLVNEALTQGIRKMVYVSSIAALGRNGAQSKTINEEQEWGESRYNSAYGLSKYLAENEVWRGIGEGLSAVIINPSVILGAGDWATGSSQIITLADREFPFYTQGINGWVGVQDVVKAMVLLMASNVDAERFIVSEGNHSYRHIFTLMAEELGKQPPKWQAGSLVTGLAWRVGGLYSKLLGKTPVITRETARTSQGQSFYDNSKLLAAIPEFSYTPIENTIREMADAYRQRS